MKIRRNQRASSRGTVLFNFLGVKPLVLGLAKTIQGGKKTATTTKKRRMMTVLENDDR